MVMICIVELNGVVPLVPHTSQKDHSDDLHIKMEREVVYSNPTVTSKGHNIRGTHMDDGGHGNIDIREFN